MKATVGRRSCALGKVGTTEPTPIASAKALYVLEWFAILVLGSDQRRRGKWNPNTGSMGKNKVSSVLFHPSLLSPLGREGGGVRLLDPSPFSPSWGGARVGG